MKRLLSRSAGTLLLIFSIAPALVAQTTAFTYQGSLNTGGSPANGNHDFEFAMFNGGGVQIGSTLTRLNVPVGNGVFAVELDFGNQFQGADRFLEIRVRPAGGGAFTTLNPRQLLTSTPHAIRALDTAQLGGVAASQYLQTGTPVINAGTGFSIGGQSVLNATQFNTSVGINAGSATAGSSNSFFGAGAGAATTTGVQNSYFGSQAGNAGTTATNNTFVGSRAGRLNTANSNSFFGSGAGANNTTGGGNAFFGLDAGNANTTQDNNSYFGFFAGINATGTRNAFFGTSSGVGTTGNSNAFFGSNAGFRNTSGADNAFFGDQAGRDNTTASQNSFFGSTTGVLNTTGGPNSFFGYQAGASNTTGSRNSFFGARAGDSNSTGNDNSYFGNVAGRFSTTGIENSFFGASAGALHTTGSRNAFFGKSAGAANIGGNDNAFFGLSAGENNTEGDANSFFGRSAGAGNTTGNFLTMIGFEAKGGNGLGNATAIGFRSFVTQSNSLVLGSINGINGATANTNVGIGTTAPTNLLTIGGPEATVVAGRVGIFSPAGMNLIMRETTANVEGVMGVNSSSGVIYGSMTNHNVNLRTNNTNRLVIDTIGNVGIGTTAPINRLTIGQPETPVINGSVGVFNGGGAFVVARDTTNNIEGLFGADENGVLFGSMTDSIVRIRTGNTTRLTFDASGNAIFSGIVNMNSFAVANTLDTGGSTQLCRNASNRLSTCSSSLRYKSNVNSFSSGLDIIDRLRPVSFNWREGGMLDLGLVAEEVAKVEPLLTTTNDTGEVEGVKYDRVGVVLINAVKEQQAQIEEQQKVIDRQQKQIDELKMLVCLSNAEAAVCKEKE